MTPSKRLRDIAVLLPLGGVILFLPPYVAIFDQDVDFGGVPFLHVSLFAAWLLGIVLTALVARRLVPPSASPNPQPAPQPGQADQPGQQRQSGQAGKAGQAGGNG